MNRQYLICDSSAVLTRDAAKLVGLFNGAVKGAQRPHEGSGHAALLSGLAAVVPGGAEGGRGCRAVSLRRFRMPVSTPRGSLR